MIHDSKSISFTDSTTAVWESFLLAVGLVVYCLNLVPDSALQWHALPGSPRSAKLPTIRAGASAVGDQMLRYCEGIRDALGRKYLSGVALHFHSDKDAVGSPMQVFTFTFEYIKPDRVPVMHLDISKSQGKGARIGKTGTIPSLEDVCRSIEVRRAPSHLASGSQD
ncbi:hypothetical protein ACQY0O_001641 [Thecaphora frezii]